MLVEGILKPRSLDQKLGWFAATFDNDISKYYSKLSGIPWRSPMNGVHATLIAGQHELRIITDTEMLPFINSTISCYTNGIVWTNTESFWMDVISNDLDLIRKELKLPSRKFHLTLGNLKNAT